MNVRVHIFNCVIRYLWTRYVLLYRCVAPMVIYFTYNYKLYDFNKTDRIRIRNETTYAMIRNEKITCTHVHLIPNQAEPVLWKPDC